jgi:predicted methyltransferase
MNITENERKLLQGARSSDFGDAYLDEYPWVFDVIDRSGLESKVARGVLSSLVKKDLIEIESSEEPSLRFTELGKRMCDEHKIERTR